MSTQDIPKRRLVTDDEIDDAFLKLRSELKRRGAKHGMHAYISKHETYGILAEEFNKELLDALHSNDHEEFLAELMDIAVGCVFGWASLQLREH